MILIADDAGSKELVDYPPLDDPGIACLCHLDSADVHFEGNGPIGPLQVGIEVKSIPDFLSSYLNGRLPCTQIPKMVEAYDVRWLLYYGRYRVGVNNRIELYVARKDRHTGKVFHVWEPWHYGSGKKKKEMSYGYLVGRLDDISCLEVATHHVPDMTTAALWIGALARSWQKQWSERDSMRTFDRSRVMPLMPAEDPAVMARASVAMRFPSIGFEKAIALARAFPSTRAMVAADVDTIAAVEWVSRKTGRRAKIGRVIARAVVEWLS